MLEPWKRKYLTGHCFDFALALSERFPSAEFVGIGSERFPSHVGLRLDGSILDVRGKLTESEFLQGIQGNDSTVIPLSRDVVELHAGLANSIHPYRGKDISEARKAARLVFPKGEVRTGPNDR